MAASSSTASAGSASPRGRHDAVLDDPDPWARYVALQNLVDPALVHKNAVKLGELLESDPNRLVRMEAAKALGRLGGKIAQMQVFALMAALRDSEPLVRRETYKTFSALGFLARPHVARVAVGLQDDFWPVRVWAVRTFSSLGSEVATPYGPRLYQLALHDAEQPVREAAAKTLGSLGAGAVPFVEELVQQLGRHEKPVEARQAGEILALLLGEPERKRRLAAAEALVPHVQLAHKNFENADWQLEGKQHDQAQQKKEVELLSLTLVADEWSTRREALETLRMWSKARPGNRA